MSRETLDINTNNSNSENPFSNEVGKRQRLIASVQKLGDLREYTESSANAIGSLEAEETIIANAPSLGLIINGSLKAAKGGRINGNSGLESRVASLPPTQVDQAQAQIDLLLNTISVIGSLASARRLEPYLPVVLPRTQAGFKTLRQIAEQYAETIPLPDNGSGDIPTALRVLMNLDEQLRIEGLKDPIVVEALSVSARQLAQVRLEKSKIDGSEQVSKIRAELAQQRIYALKREPVEVPGTRGFSRYEVLANQIIEREGLFAQTDSARAEAEARLKREQETVLNVIAKKRAIGTVISLIDQDPLLCQVLAQRSRLNPDDLLTADLGKKRLIANNALNAKKIILSVEDRRMFNGQTVIAEERAKLTQALLDPLSFIARLTDDELLVIRTGISKISDERSIYELAGERLKKQLEDEVTDSEIISALTGILSEQILVARAPDAVNAAIAELGIDGSSVLKDPSKLDQLKDEIIARGLELVVSASQEETNVGRALTITDSERRRQREVSLALMRARESNSRASDTEARLLLDQSIEEPGTDSLGVIKLREDIKSTLGPFQTYPEYKTTYPRVVTQALENLYGEYNQAFRRLVAANKEFDTEYQYCLSPDGTPINSFVQIDMVGLPAGFLEQAETLREEDVREALRGRIFEIENSIAMYSLLEYFFSDGTQDTLFKRQFRGGLDDIRQKYGRPIALLAATDQKYQAMRETEFGKRDGEPLTDDEVSEYSGFDKFFSPEEFKKYLEENGGESSYLLYVRSSDPVAKMKRPDLVIDEELLADENLRRIIKANALTFNIDNPNLPIGDSRRINDTKEYLGAMGMAFPVFYGEDLTSPEFNSYLRSQGVDPTQVESGERLLRAKPMKGTYGGYGHFRGTPGDARFRRELRDALLKRGSYVVQPELQNPTITNQDDGRSYMYIDRVFFSNDGQNYRFMGGERTLMPIDSIEAQNNRVHGNSSSVYAEII
ncbi:MAG: hypothetical protein HYT07_03860 [Candidatus Levybacteria bacterium]|nr:hypothetical protein [Candidatus Levybacteria bacterium]